MILRKNCLFKQLKRMTAAAQFYSRRLLVLLIGQQTNLITTVCDSLLIVCAPALREHHNYLQNVSVLCQV